MIRVLHILPHRGGGGEAVVRDICTIPAFQHELYYLAASRKASTAIPSLMKGLGGLPWAVRGCDLVHILGDASVLLSHPFIRSRPAVWSTQGLHLLRRSEGMRGRLVAKRLHTSIAATRATICSSHSERQELSVIAGSGLTEKLVEVPNGVVIPPPTTDEERVAARRELGLLDGQVAALYLGELEARKRPLDAIAATRKVRRSTSQLVLLVAGRGPLASDVAAEEDDGIRVLGFRSDPANLLKAADILLMPSEREGMALAVLEAMAFGVPVIASDGPGNPDAVRNAGLIHRTADVDGMANMLKLLVTDAGERARLGEMARARVENHYALGRFLADVEAVFTAVVDGRKPWTAIRSPGLRI